ncbi:hypothetical protein POPTR_008G023400v4 [Populus trichocarpa]|nr:hypothetical protein BDE02_08G019200 [Populus trichocarpa]KAI9389272.1 hypothetical protein POPTR_008G023400v4 [Populus trichocarpa]
MLQASSRPRKEVIKLLKFLGIKQIYDVKLNHIYSDELLRRMVKHISTLDFEKYDECGLFRAFNNAVKNGIVEMIVEMVKVCPNLMHTFDKNGRVFLMSSVAHRQEKIFSLFYGLEGRNGNFLSVTDVFDNTMLHCAGELSPSTQLARISGAALQMQRELQWYREVESIVNPRAKTYCNQNGETPGQLFTKSHEKLMAAGEKWMKQVATSSTVVGALIITVMFTAAFTVPGGNKDTGFPVFLHEKSFLIFIISDAISLFASSTSVLMFLGILTSRYSENDFLISFPRKLVIGLSTLFISVAAMMVAFCAALRIVMDGRLEVVIPVSLLAGIPVTLFILLQFPLLVEIFMSTYGPGIFNRKMKRWY